MAQFLGWVRGTKGAASRLGGKASGLKVEACSWQGRIVVELIHNFETGEDHFTVYQAPHQGHGISQPIASGIVGCPKVSP